MTLQSPLEAMEQFLTRIAPFDPEPHGRPAMTVEFRAGHHRGSYVLTEHAARALHEALCRYNDPQDQGQCDHCAGRRLDEHLACRDCGHVNGVFGAVLLEYAGKVGARDN
jgi:hypothetical protein